MAAKRLGVQAALVGRTVVGGDVEVEDGRISAVGLPVGRRGGRGLAAPGLVDLQVNGFAGMDLARGFRAEVGEALLAAGTTAYQPTFVTAPEAELAAALAEPAPGGGRSGARVLGAHLEGPFLAPGRLGAHPPEHRRDPDPELLRRLLAAGLVSQVTLAPERPGALELVDLLAARGVLVSVGHTEATAAQAHAAFDRGARAVTHLHNAMAPGTHRAPGAATAALAREDVTVCAIADGHHLAADTLLAAWRAARGRLALVSDAAGATLGGRPVRPAPDGSLRDPEGRLAGSAASLLDGVRTLRGLGVPLEEALGAASAVPARLAGRPDLGRLEPGAPADVVVLSDGLELLGVLVGGHAY